LEGNGIIILVAATGSKFEGSGGFANLQKFVKPWNIRDMFFINESRKAPLKSMEFFDHRKVTSDGPKCRP